MSDLPDGIGAHEGREFDLMRRGHKDVALFFELEPEGLEAMLGEGYILLKFRQFVHQGLVYFTCIVFRPGFEAAAMRLKHLVEDKAHGLDPAKEQEIGKILGYTPEQVQAYLDHVRSTRT